MNEFVFLKARDVRTSEVVAIKKMSYSGKQSNEVKINTNFLMLFFHLKLREIVSPSRL